MFDFFAANAGEIAIISHYGNDATMERFFRRKTMAICTDGLMPGPGQKPHPRSLGSFPKALRMAREMGIPLVEMVWRMATLPCRFLNLPDPTLRVGADASLTLFDPATVRERNDYLNPRDPAGGDRLRVDSRGARARPRRAHRAAAVPGADAGEPGRGVKRFIAIAEGSPLTVSPGQIGRLDRRTRSCADVASLQHSDCGA